MRARFYDHAGSPARLRLRTQMYCLPLHDTVGTQKQFSIAAQWLACMYSCRRFTDTVADACARLGADVVRYSFIAGDLHPLLLAGLPAHLCKNPSLFQFRGSSDPSAIKKN